MCEQFLNRYGFGPADEECIEVCSRNPLIIPKLVRYREMGVWEVLADVRDRSDRFFLIKLGGPNCYEVEDSFEAMRKLTIKDTLDLITLQSKLDTMPWSSIGRQIGNEDVIIQEVTIHNALIETE